MTKDELMLLTIQQLVEHFYMYPECFELEDPEHNPEHRTYNNVTIIFQSKHDPTSNYRTILLTYNAVLDTIICHIYFRSITLPTTSNTVKPDASSSVKVEWKWFNRQYRLFRKLRNHIIDRKKSEENNEFLHKLHSAFPGTFDDYIFGKPK